jgi:DNA-directed RNA polymerase specialized sigma24 family protein
MVLPFPIARISSRRSRCSSGIASRPGGADCVASTWIYRAALNTALAWRRKERKHAHGRQGIEDATGLLIAPSGRDPRLDWIYRSPSSTR